MEFAEFKSRALKEGLRYGEDRMVFLRELAQNARDAGARRIGVATFIEGSDLVVNFGDDGSGMEYDHARRFLFTLYASSKERDQRSAGLFGVGFWSVLLFKPDRIIIESMTEEDDGWAVALDGDLAEPRRVTCGLRTPGTRVSLRRRMDTGEAERTLIEVERALKRYCRYLRRNDRAASVLPVHLNGKRIDRPFSIAGPCWLAFRDGSIEGAVGLGDRPRVDLYARGLLVWRGTTLDELHYGAPPVAEPAHPEGLAPVYVLNGNDLSVTLDRRAVVDDRALGRLRRVARRRMRELLGRYLDGVSPRPLGERLTSYLAGQWEELKLAGQLGPIVAFVAAFLIVGALGLVGFRLLGGLDETAGAGAPGADPIAATALVSTAAPLGSAAGYGGPMVHLLGTPIRTQLSYRPPEPQLLRAVAAERLHPGRGILADPPVVAAPAPLYRCAAQCVEIEATLAAAAGLVVLPAPTGHRVESGSVSLGAVALPALVTTAEGATAVQLAQPASGTLSYRTGPGTELLDGIRRERLLAVPDGMRLPPELDALSRRAAGEPDVAARVELIRADVERRLIYDRSRETVAAYRSYLAADPAAGWVEFVTTLGRGDCDVKNALAVLLLRRSGIPARLAIGYAGRAGRAQPGMHAWIEYYDGGWIAADATGTAGIADPALAAPVPVTASAPGPAPSPTAAPLPAAAAPSLEPRLPQSVAAEQAAPFAPAETAAEGSPDWLVTVAIIAGVVAVLAALLIVILLLAGRGEQRLIAPGTAAVRRRVAAEMLTSALMQPEVWLRGSGLSSRRLLPVHGRGTKLSLKEAAELGRRGRLWLSDGQASLVRQAVRRGARILDSADKAFGEIIKRLPGVIDLDEVARLQPATTERLPAEHQGVGVLIDEVDALVTLVGRPARSVVVCLGLRNALSRDVDLSGLGLSGGQFPRRFVAVSPHLPAVRRRAALRRTNPFLAAFLTLDLLLGRSELLAPDQRELRRLAARATMEATE